MSPPYDHDLNPIAERVIAVIETLTIAAKSSSGAPIGFWPYVVLNAVNWHTVNRKIGGQAPFLSVSHDFCGRFSHVLGVSVALGGGARIVSIPKSGKTKARFYR